MSSISEDGDNSGIRVLRTQNKAEIDELAEYHEFLEYKQMINESKGRILDGENTPQNISLYGFLLGVVSGGGLIYALFIGSTEAPQLGYFLCALGLFHFLEYLATALFNPHKLSLDCKSYIHIQINNITKKIPEKQKQNKNVKGRI